MPEARIFPFAFEFSATPPARHTLRQLRFFDGRADQRQHGALAGVLDCERNILETVVDFAFRLACAGPAAFRFGDRAQHLFRTAAALHAIGHDPRDDQMRSDLRRAPVGREAHDFPFVAVGHEIRGIA